MKKLLFVTLFAVLCSPAFADEFLKSWNLTGARAAITFATTSVAGATMSYAVQVPEGNQHASVWIKGSGYDLNPGDAVSGSITNATVTILGFNNANLPVQMEAAGISGIPGYDQDSADETFDAMPSSNTTGISSYGFYAIPTYGFKFLSVVYSVSGATGGENSVVIDFNPPPK